MEGGTRFGQKRRHWDIVKCQISRMDGGHVRRIEHGKPCAIIIEVIQHILLGELRGCRVDHARKSQDDEYEYCKAAHANPELQSLRHLRVFEMLQMQNRTREPDINVGKIGRREGKLTGSILLLATHNGAVRLTNFQIQDI